jgi:hypothetical protein
MGAVFEDNRQLLPRIPVSVLSLEMRSLAAVAGRKLTPFRLGDGRLEFYVKDRVRHRDGLISRGTIPFFERDFVGYRVTE